MSVLIYNHNKMTRIYDPLDNQGKCSWLESSLMRKRGARWPEGAVKCFIAPRPQKEGAIDASHDRHDKKYQKRIGTSWDRRRIGKGWADKARKQAGRQNQIVGRQVGGEVSVGIVRRWRRTDIRYISKAVWDQS
ncbi:hypothetical protein PPACK8108_LOCUS22434 [Phakopsora pachyrhizi]|uniref:Uncharacterized protein n=1 Tax=Phakopsora pachyrhizi TaxID=170000 RepID=A0AAV0BLY2_PHAPC|nr:hypothetical protein PPACK8108_LOCUS22434 [Phakopsora pachyrhizi]